MFKESTVSVLSKGEKTRAKVRAIIIASAKMAVSASLWQVIKAVVANCCCSAHGCCGLHVCFVGVITCALLYICSTHKNFDGDQHETPQGQLKAFVFDLLHVSSAGRWSSDHWRGWNE